MKQTDPHLDALAGAMEGWLRRFLERGTGPATRLYGMMGYHLGWLAATLEPRAQPSPSGKRLRPLLCLLACEAVGGPAEAAAAPAIAVELVHNFSLIHDDIQDGSEFRRHLKAVWAIWGMPQGINVGDGLFALAQLALLEPSFGQREPELLVEATRELNQTCLRLVEGQYLDLALQEAGRAQFSEYRTMVAGKTAALFRCACRLGALFGGGTPDEVEALAEFGFHLGHAFQYKDDLDGIWGLSQSTGKAPAEDLEARKMGLPAVLALEHAPATQRRRFQHLFQSSGQLKAQEVRELVGLMDELGVRTMAALLTEETGQAALAALGRAGARVQTARLEGLSRQLLNLA